MLWTKRQRLTLVWWWVHLRANFSFPIKRRWRMKTQRLTSDQVTSVAACTVWYFRCFASLQVVRGNSIVTIEALDRIWELVISTRAQAILLRPKTSSLLHGIITPAQDGSKEDWERMVTMIIFFCSLSCGRVSTSILKIIAGLRKRHNSMLWCFTQSLPRGFWFRAMTGERMWVWLKSYNQFEMICGRPITRQIPSNKQCNQRTWRTTCK